jgi:hypothetical protein
MQNALLQFPNGLWFGCGLDGLGLGAKYSLRKVNDVLDH